MEYVSSHSLEYAVTVSIIISIIIMLVVHIGYKCILMMLANRLRQFRVLGVTQRIFQTKPDGIIKPVLIGNH